MKQFVTVYQPGPPHFHEGLLWSWNREQREAKERNVARYNGYHPSYRINLRMKP